MNPEIDYYFTCISPFTYLSWSPGLSGDGPHRECQGQFQTRQAGKSICQFRRKARSGTSGMPPGLPLAGN